MNNWSDAKLYYQVDARCRKKKKEDVQRIAVHLSEAEDDFCAHDDSSTGQSLIEDSCLWMCRDAE